MSDAKPLDLGDRVAFWAAEGEPAIEHLQEMLKRYEATVQALAELVRLKDGPRDEAYERDKPGAWEAARRALPPSPEALDLRHASGGRLLSDVEDPIPS